MFLLPGKSREGETKTFGARGRKARLLRHQSAFPGCWSKGFVGVSYGPVVDHVGEKILCACMGVWCLFQPTHWCHFERKMETGGGWEAGVTRIPGLRKEL